MTSTLWAYPLHDAAPVPLSGPDRIDFLQRQTTNDINRLTSEQSVATVLTSATARILDLFTVLFHDDETLLLLPQPGRADALTAYLRSKIFFMDKVTVSEPMTGLASWLLAGADAPAALAHHGYPLPGEGAYSLVKQAERSAWTVTMPGWSTPAYHLVLPVDESPPSKVLNRTQFEQKRIMAGIPAVGHELTDAYTPFEVGLGNLVSGTKGCYTGQEILARQVTYDKVTRQLCCLRLSSAVLPGDELRVDDKRAGTVTSVVESEAYGLLALGVIKKPYHEPGTEVLVLNDAGEAFATVLGLPVVE